MTTRSTSRLAAAILIPAVLIAACGGATGSGAPASGGVVPSTGIALPSDLVLPSDFALPSDLAIPSFDLGSLVTNLENVDSYRVTIASADGTDYSGTVVTRPVVARDLHMGSGDSATHIVTIGDEAWMGTGDGPLQTAPSALISSSGMRRMEASRASRGAPRCAMRILPGTGTGPPRSAASTDGATSFGSTS